MELTVNGETTTLEGDRFAVDELLDRLEVEATEGLAVAVGTRVVPQSKWDETVVEEGDEVEIIRATQGG